MTAALPDMGYPARAQIPCQGRFCQGLLEQPGLVLDVLHGERAVAPLKPVLGSCWSFRSSCSPRRASRGPIEAGSGTECERFGANVLHGERAVAPLKRLYLEQHRQAIFWFSTASEP